MAGHRPSAAGQSEESRRGEVPESLEQAKGEGEDGKSGAGAVATNPDGEPYPTLTLRRAFRAARVRHRPPLAGIQAQNRTFIRLHPITQGGLR